jgi:hypothetical protein
MVACLWNEFAEQGPGNGPSASTLEHLFQLFVMFWTENTYRGPLEENAIVHFSGVLGIHPHDLVYRRASDYTPLVSALIWLGRLIIFEYALPLRAYTHLPHVWPERAAYANQVARLRDEIRPRYLQRGSPSPIGYLIERLQHGRATARREGPKAQISWSMDGQLLRIDQKSIWMSQFRTMVHGAVARAHQQTQDLLFQ